MYLSSVKKIGSYSFLNFSFSFLFSFFTIGYFSLSPLFSFTIFTLLKKCLRLYNIIQKRNKNWQLFLILPFLAVHPSEKSLEGSMIEWLQFG